jgi:hypothetical protein
MELSSTIVQLICVNSMIHGNGYSRYFCYDRFFNDLHPFGGGATTTGMGFGKDGQVCQDQVSVYC